ncbi:peptide/nickel transport system ATP-binding protein [Paenibacillus sp. UNCCL117]|uniref:ABC transporter ATP-binding protein n=1 Tax=unclassified Paenibacillus TaxID=185978 RepID=UPI00088D9BA5|nr:MULTISPECIES: ABC transporter ATP-binding protein [unclassified Paenibacillus]SDD79359.1 peptide/nickel transport system ATP-binding protein [Paenibacillus sp. cl123]SFW53176.1 peptide/nickel transport system ATP-binding protein [Paenibacillus sp. UNCCL117]
MELSMLQVRHLKTYFFTENGAVPSVDGVSFELREGETLGIVGESGSGKSVTSLSIMRLIDKPGEIIGGEIRFKDKDLLKLGEAEMRTIRGREIGMVFQEPLTALNPVFRIGHQIAESLIHHLGLSQAEAKRRTLELLTKVRIPRPESVYKAYPHELSGGMRQRAMIAMAIACRPKLIIADEPTTALDVSVQAQVLDIMKDIIDQEGSSMLLITHDLGVIAEMADRVAVMYAGQLVEQCDVHALFSRPLHPYTRGLLHSTPKLGRWGEPLASIEGAVPNPLSMPSGCRFHPRCPHALPACAERQPSLYDQGSHHEVRCLMYDPHYADLWKEAAVHGTTG